MQIPGVRAALAQCRKAPPKKAVQQAEELLSSISDQLPELVGPTLAASRALEAEPGYRAAVLLKALEQLERGVTGVAGFQAQFASSLRDPLSQAPDDVYKGLCRGLLDGMAETAPTPEEKGYLRFLSGLSHLSSDPSGLLNMASRIGMETIGDVSRPGWLAVVGRGSCQNARSAEELEKVGAFCLDAIRRRSDEPVIREHDRLDQTAGLSDHSRKWLRMAALGALSREIPSDMAGPAIAYEFSRCHPEPEERARLWAAVLGARPSDSELTAVRKRVEQAYALADIRSELRNRAWSRQHGIRERVLDLSEIARKLVELEEPDKTAALREIFAGLALSEPQAVDIAEALGDWGGGDASYQVALDWFQARNPDDPRVEMLVRVARESAARGQEGALRNGLRNLLTREQLPTRIGPPSGHIEDRGAVVIVGGVPLPKRGEKIGWLITSIPTVRSCHRTRKAHEFAARPKCHRLEGVSPGPAVWKACHVGLLPRD